MSTLPFSGPKGRKTAVTPPEGTGNQPVSHTISQHIKFTPHCVRARKPGRRVFAGMSAVLRESRPAPCSVPVISDLRANLAQYYLAMH